MNFGCLTIIATSTKLGQRGITSLMPDQAYHDPNYKWDYDQED